VKELFWNDPADSNANLPCGACARLLHGMKAGH
jgi:hypothetical protein